jgi:DNA invertase Pin-like site-specific DNA recombinase
MRYAPLIRVSTEKQEQQGESLHTQEKQIQQYVQSLGGTIPEYCWQYSGQEHGTSDFERKMLNKLLSDASNDLFDAVIVADASRWSRDNQKSKEGLQILRDNQIKFFVGTTQYDLYNPEHTFFLGMAAEFGEFQARQQSLKSIVNRIERAKDENGGHPSCGKRPYGRTFDKATKTWGIEEEKKQRIEWVAEQYLSGGKMSVIAKQVGMNHSNLWKILTKRSGTKWTQKFNVKKLNVSEEIVTTIPPLLSDEIIDAIKNRAKSNKTYTHGEYKHRYLLASMVLCGECGNAMVGQTNHGNRQYYRHQRGLKTPCNPSLWIRAEELENIVIEKVFELYGNPDVLKEAVARNMVQHDDIEKLEKKLAGINNNLANIEKQRSRLINAVAEGNLKGELIKQKNEDLDSQKETFESEQRKILRMLSSIPDHRQRLTEMTAYMKSILFEKLGYKPNELQKLSMKQKARIAGAVRRSENIDLMSYEEKRKLLQLVFDGKDASGKRLGVYVKKKSNGDCHYDIHGFISMTTQETGVVHAGTIESNEKSQPLKEGIGGCRSKCSLH